MSQRRPTWGQLEVHTDVKIMAKPFFQYFKVIREILWESLGGPFGDVFGRPWGGLGRLWGRLGKPWGRFGRPWGRLGWPWGRLGGPSRESLGKT